MNSTKKIENIAMKRCRTRSLGHRIRAMVAVVALLGFAWWLGSDLGAELVGATISAPQDSIPNNHPAKNPDGKAATFSNRRCGSPLREAPGLHFHERGTSRSGSLLEGALRAMQAADTDVVLTIQWRPANTVRATSTENPHHDKEPTL